MRCRGKWACLQSASRFQRRCSVLFVDRALNHCSGARFFPLKRYITRCAGKNPVRRRDFRRQFAVCVCHFPTRSANRAVRACAFASIDSCRRRKWSARVLCVAMRVKLRERDLMFIRLYTRRAPACACPLVLLYTDQFPIRSSAFLCFSNKFSAAPFHVLLHARVFIRGAGHFAAICAKGAAFCVETYTLHAQITHFLL